MDKPAILIISCDKYADVWPAFFYTFDKFWPDCPYPIYLVSNHTSYNHPSVIPVLLGDDIDYSTNLLNALEHVPSDYIILWIEDMLMCRKQPAEIEGIIAKAIAKDVSYLRLWKSEDNLGEVINPGLHTLPKGLKFRVSLKPALWKQKTLKKLIVKGENPHQLERLGTKRSYQLPDTFCGLTSEIQPFRPRFINSIYRGAYEPGALKFLKDVGFEFERIDRPIRSSIYQKIRNKVITQANKFIYVFHKLYVRASGM